MSTVYLECVFFSTLHPYTSLWLHDSVRCKLRWRLIRKRELEKCAETCILQCCNFSHLIVLVLDIFIVLGRLDLCRYNIWVLYSHSVWPFDQYVINIMSLCFLTSVYSLFKTQDQMVTCKQIKRCHTYECGFIYLRCWITLLRAKFLCSINLF